MFCSSLIEILHRMIQIITFALILILAFTEITSSLRTRCNTQNFLRHRNDIQCTLLRRRKDARITQTPRRGREDRQEIQSPRQTPVAHQNTGLCRHGPVDQPTFPIGIQDEATHWVQTLCPGGDSETAERGGNFTLRGKSGGLGGEVRFVL